MREPTSVDLEPGFYLPAGAENKAIEVVSRDRQPLSATQVIEIDTGFEEQQYQGRFLISAHFDGIDFVDRWGGVPVRFSFEGDRIHEFQSGDHDTAEYVGSMFTTSTGVGISRFKTGLLEFYDVDGSARKMPIAEATVGDVSPLASGGYVATKEGSFEVLKLSPSAEIQGAYTLFEAGPMWKRAQDRSLIPVERVRVWRDMVVVTAGGSYAVAAFDEPGSSRWMLRAKDWSPVPVPEDILQRTMERERRAGRAMSATVDEERNSGEWTQYYPAIGDISIDAQGRVYIFHYVPRGSEHLPVPVDVIDASGDPVVAGTLPFTGWQSAYEDTVFRVEVRDERVVIAGYRLMLEPPTSPTNIGQ